MAYYDEESGDGLGALPMRATGYIVPGRTMFSPLQSAVLQAALARKQAADAEAARKAAEKPVAISPTGAVPPPPSEPTVTLDKARYPCGTRTDPTRPCPEPTFSTAVVPAPLAPSGGGGVGPISVSVSPGLVEPAAVAAAPRGFGMVEAALALGVTALLGMAFTRKGKR